MSTGKSGAPIGVVAVPVALAGLAAICVAKCVQKGYKFVKNTRAETSRTVHEVWLSEMSKKTSVDEFSLSNPDSILNLSFVEISGVSLDNVCSQITSMSKHNDYNSSLLVNNYSVIDSHESVYTFSSSEQDNVITFTKRNGKYYAVGDTSSTNELSNNIYNMVSTFYVNDLYYQLTHDWGFGQIKTEQQAGIYTLKAKDKDAHEMTIEVNRKNGQVSFQGIPVRLRDQVSEWLHKFTECRTTQFDNGGVGETLGEQGQETNR